MPKPRRKRSLWTGQCAALTPDGLFAVIERQTFSDEQIAALPEKSKKGTVLYYIEALHRRIEQQQNAIEDLKRVIAQREAFIAECKRAFSELGPLLPSHIHKEAE
jgi:hypothetical protein